MGWVWPDLASIGFAASVVAAAVATPIAAATARRLDVLDRPAGHKKHGHATPLLGGWALAVGGVLGWLAALVADPAFAKPAPTPFGLALAAGTVLLLIVGCRDDIRPLGVVPKLAAQLVTAVGLVLCLDGGPVQRLGAAFVVVLLTNAFNLLDNADGSTATVAAIGGLGAAAWLGPGGQDALAALCLAGACLGFLLFNRPPARIFMGDAGSLPLGFLLSGLAVGEALQRLDSHDDRGPVAVAVATVFVCLFLVPLLDTGLVIVSRLRRGKNPLTTPGRDHLAHRLRRLGLGAGTGLAVLAGLAGGGLGLAAAVQTARLDPLWIWAGLAVAAAPAFIYLETLVEPSPLSAVRSTAASRNDDETSGKGP